ncbi:MAG: carboxypeptidase-like regulatory domain-containing protein [Prochlorothrix sp.]
MSSQSLLVPSLVAQSLSLASIASRLLSRRLVAPLVSTLALLGVSTPTLAHGVQTDYALDLFSAELELTTTYSSGDPLEAATVMIYAPGNGETPWLETTTDDQGRISFVPDVTQPGEWKVYIEREGHGDILHVPVKAEGVDFNQISQGPQQDFHLASPGSGLTDAMLLLYGLGTGTIVAWDYQRRVRR